MTKPKIGLQLIVYGGRPNEDFAGVLREAAEAGYGGVETGAIFTAEQVPAAKQALADACLEYCGLHGGFDDIADSARVQELCSIAKELGGHYLICSGVAPGEGIAQYEKAADVFNAAGAEIKKAGLTFAYHNHAWEFEEFDGVKGIHRLNELIDPRLVKLCVDVYWVSIGGENPAEFITRYADRAEYFHFKDGAPGEFVELGQGTVDLVGAKDAALKTVKEWIVVEQDRSAKEPKVSIAESIQYLRSIGL
jgi:sugar phosphate isomerase/epimerase